MNNYTRFPLPEYVPKSKYILKSRYYKLLLLILVLGIIIGIVISLPFHITEEELLNKTRESFNYGISYGMEYTVSIITNQSIQCNQIPMNYSGYSYTLYPLECLEKVGGLE